MSLRVGAFYYVETKGGPHIPDLPFNPERMVDVLPIVWSHNGLMRVLPQEYVNNAVTFNSQASLISAANRDWLQKHPLVFSWSQCIEVDTRDVPGLLKMLSVLQDKETD